MSVWFAVAATLVAPQEPAVTTIQVPPHVVVTGTLRTDLDGDGRQDLVLACRDTDTGRRELRRHLHRADGRAFDNAPSLPPYVLEPDVIAFTFADVTPAAGRELVLLTAERVVAMERAATAVRPTSRSRRHGWSGRRPIRSSCCRWPKHAATWTATGATTCCCRSRTGHGSGAAPQPTPRSC